MPTAAVHILAVQHLRAPRSNCSIFFDEDVLVALRTLLMLRLCMLLQLRGRNRGQVRSFQNPGSSIVLIMRLLILMTNFNGITSLCLLFNSCFVAESLLQAALWHIVAEHS